MSKAKKISYVAIFVIACLIFFFEIMYCIGYYRKGAVAADTWDCSQVGVNILRNGGSAVDAAIAALICTSFFNPQSMGIGGGSIFTVMDSSGKVTIINSRETVPRNVTSDLLELCSNNTSKTSTGKWIGVPGELRGYKEAHRRFGKLPWAELFKETLELVKHGIRINEVHGGFIKVINESAGPALRKLYSHENGTFLKTDDTVKFEKLMETLKIIADEGADAFYNDEMAKNLVSDINEAGGNITMDDLKEYKVSVTDAWVVPLGEYQMYIPPPPAGGVILSFLLNVLKGFHFNSNSLEGESKTLTYHRYIETLKFANGLKKDIRDPKFMSTERLQRAKTFTTDSFADDIRSFIGDESQYYHKPPYMDSVGTSHVSVVTKDGSAVSVTSSINYVFGSRILSPSTGVILNNQLADFCQRVDKFSPGEQPPSSMAPIVLKSKSKLLVIGGSGGDRITTGVASVLINHLWFGKSLKQAIKAPVVFVNSDNEVEYEKDFDEDVIKALKALGHKQKDKETYYSVVNAVELEDGCISAESDERKKGQAAGF
ncbi:glutathione hydrolase 5 proenzyme-like [Morone saxatilis]|uniref:glutathione hydrolase 5 proenzyme-like n=1 Tax=Morone saxatilis TaxID=34816 RepID=UPI0015E20B87|nr:glutathione hydrolase 5 proenzyme-like [Morone saxatilis]